jgi:predicted alpha/beta superfamily hydrolase
MKISIFLVPIFLFSTNLSVAQIKVHFLLTDIPSKHRSDSVYAAGSFNTWVPDQKGSHFSAGPDGHLMLDYNLPKGKYQYKLTRGSWAKVETRKNGSDVSNRELNLQNDTTVFIRVEGWKDDFPTTVTAKKHTASPNVIVLDSAFEIPQLNRTRRIWAYLPADYLTSKKKYPVLYMHDGQALFDEFTSAFGEWGIDECLDTLFRKGANECIVIGIDNSAAHRMTEYNAYDFRNFGKPEGNEYVGFLVNTLKPYIDSHLRTLPDKKNTFIAGSSMGGLISMVAVMQFPDVFGGAGIFSPSFWTAPKLNDDLKPVARDIRSKLFFYAGGSESEDMLPDMKKIEEILRAASPAKIKEIVDPVQKHNEAAWRKYFPGFIKWMLDYD